VRKFICFFALLSAMTQCVFGSITANEMSAAIDQNKLKHPYLYFAEQDKPALLDRIKKDQDFYDILERNLAEARRLLYAPVDPMAPAREVRNPRYDGNYKYNNYIDTYSNNAFVLAFAYQFTGDEQYAAKAYEFADAVCDQASWVHTAHEFHQIYDRIWPMGAKDDQVVFSFAQHTDHMLFLISAVYDWLYPALEKRQRDRIRSAILQNAILRVRGNYEYFWWATAYRCNWCSVCHSSLGVAALALLTEDPNLSDVIAVSFNSISKNLDEIQDGGWCEGMDYLDYTLTTSEHFGFVLKRMTSGKYDLYKHPRYADGLKTMMYGQFPGNTCVHFSDSGSNACGSFTLYNRLMLETGNELAAWLRDQKGFDKPTTIYDLFSPKANVRSSLPEKASVYFPAVGWVIMRSDFTDSHKVALAAKCGKHDDPHHGHLDSGHFSLFWLGKEFLCDHGSAGYDGKYFDEDRWSYPLVLNSGHNTVLVNGERQIPGKHKNQPWNYEAGGKIVEFRPGNHYDYALMDASDAFAKKFLKKWRRHLILEKPDMTVVVDEVTCHSGDEIDVRFHSAVDQEILDNLVLLKSGPHTMAIIPLVCSPFSVRPGRHSILPAINGEIFRQIPYFDITCRAPQEQSVIASIILPVQDRSEAISIMQSSRLERDNTRSLRVIVHRDDKNYTYSFAGSSDGLVLK
jgi:hypothetical protein